MSYRRLSKHWNFCREFSNLHRNPKQTDPEVILKALILVCRGYSYEQASRFVLRKYQTLISTNVISKWMKEYLKRVLNANVPQASSLPSANNRDKAGWKPAVQTKSYTPEQTVISHVFTHRDLNYNFQVHRPKLDRCDTYTIAAEVPVWMDLKNVDAVSPPRSMQEGKRGGDTASTINNGSAGRVALPNSPEPEGGANRPGEPLKRNDDSLGEISNE